MRPASRPVQVLAHVFEGGAAVTVVSHVLPHALLELAGGPHGLAVYADHVDLGNAIDVAATVQLDRADALLELHRTPAEVVHQRRVEDLALLHPDGVAVNLNRLRVDVVTRVG